MNAVLDMTNPLLWIILLAVLLPILYLAIRPFRAYMKFVYPNAKYEAMGNPFIQKQQLDAIMDAKNLSSFIETVNSKKTMQIKGDSILEVHQHLEQAWEDTLTMMKQDTSKTLHPFFDAYVYQKDVELVAQALKQKLFQVDIPQNIYTYLNETATFLDQLRDIEPDHLPQHLENWGFPPALIKEVTEESPRFMVMDVLLYQHGIQRLKNTNVPYKADKPKQLLIKTLLDITNIRMALRAKQRKYDAETCSLLFVGEGRELPQWKFTELCETDNPKQVVQHLEGTAYYHALSKALDDYAQTPSIQWFEIALDRYLLQLLKELSVQYYMHLGPTLRFLLSRQYELQNLRVIAKGISEQLSSKDIRPLLVWEEPR